MQKGRQHTGFLSTLDRWDDQTVLDAKDAIDALIESPGWEAVVKLIEAEHVRIRGLLQHGNVMEQAEYARELGKLVGLEAVQAVTEAVVMKARAIEHRHAQAEAEMAGVE